MDFRRDHILSMPKVVALIGFFGHCSLRRITPKGEEFVLELESELGRTVIEGTTAVNTFRVGNPDIGGLKCTRAALFSAGARRRPTAWSSGRSTRA